MRPREQRFRGAAPARAASHDRRHAGRRAVADSRRHRRCRALDAGLFRAAGVEHRARRLVHVAVEPEPARDPRLCVRRELAVRHAAFTWAVRRRRRRADRQDGGVVDGNLQRARSDSLGRRRRRAREGQELSVAAFPGRVRDDRGSCGASRGARDLRAAGPVLRRLRCQRSRRHGRYGAARRCRSRRAEQPRRRRRRRSRADRGGHSRAELRIGTRRSV